MKIERTSRIKNVARFGRTLSTLFPFAWGRHESAMRGIAGLPQMADNANSCGPIVAFRTESVNLTLEQIEAAKAGKPVRIELPDGGTVYLLGEDFYEQMLLLLQSEPEQEAFRKFSMRQAQRLASENTSG